LRPTDCRDWASRRTLKAYEPKSHPKVGSSGWTALFNKSMGGGHIQIEGKNLLIKASWYE